MPISEFGRNDADLHLIVLAARGVFFAEKSEDLWYRATKPLVIKTTTGGVTKQNSYYESNEPLWPMGCLSQYQYCHNSLKKDGRCTDLGGFYETMHAAIQMMNGDEGGEVQWALSNLKGPTTSEIIKYLGVKSLTSRFQLASSGAQSFLEPNQWHLDVIHWFSTTLAATQLQLLNSVIGLKQGNTGLERLWARPQRTGEKRLCQSHVKSFASTKYVHKANRSRRKSAVPSICPSVFLVYCSYFFLAQPP